MVVLVTETAVDAVLIPTPLIISSSDHRRGPTPLEREGKKEGESDRERGERGTIGNSNYYRVN